MTNSTGEALDAQIEDLYKRTELLAKYLDVEFEYRWNELLGIKRKEDK